MADNIEQKKSGSNKDFGLSDQELSAVTGGREEAVWTCKCYTCRKVLVSSVTYDIANQAKMNHQNTPGYQDHSIGVYAYGPDEEL